jgi:hypothetical protein
MPAYAGIRSKQAQRNLPLFHAHIQNNPPDATHFARGLLRAVLDRSVVAPASEFDYAVMHFDADRLWRQRIVASQLGKDFLLNLSIVFHGIYLHHCSFSMKRIGRAR